MFCTAMEIPNLNDQIATFQSFLDEINLKFYEEYNEDVIAIKDGILNRARFLRLEHNGPQLGVINLLLLIN
jgi:glycogen debranching enzyme